MGSISNLTILFILKKGDSYGYEIINTLKEISDGKINWKAGSLYPLLNKMQKQKLIKDYWNTEHDRPRKYYKILKKGLDELDNILEERALVNNILDKLMN